MMANSYLVLMLGHFYSETYLTLLADDDERFLGLLLRDDDADEELRDLLRVRMLLLACEAPAPPPGGCLGLTLTAAAAAAEAALVMCSTLSFVGSSRSESDIGASLLLELKLLWCRILRLLLVVSAAAAAAAVSLLSHVAPPVAVSVF